MVMTAVLGGACWTSGGGDDAGRGSGEGTDPDDREHTHPEHRHHSGAVDVVVDGVDDGARRAPGDAGLGAELAAGRGAAAGTVVTQALWAVRAGPIS